MTIKAGEKMKKLIERKEENGNPRYKELENNKISRELAIIKSNGCEVYITKKITLNPRSSNFIEVEMKRILPKSKMIAILEKESKQNPDWYVTNCVW